MTGPTFTDSDRDLIEESCPVCDGQVGFAMTCHTWGGKADGTGWMMCSSGCSSAMDFYCLGRDTSDASDNDECDWYYTWGLNPRNPRSPANEARRPPWIDPDAPYPW